MQANHKKDSCSCKNHLTIPKKEVSGLILIGIFILCAAFSAGYFWGKKQTVQSANQEIQKIIALNYMWQKIPTYNAGNTQSPEEHSDQSPSHEALAECQSSEQSAHNTGTKAAPHESWYARLCGFGSHAAAKSYSDMLNAHGIPVFVSTRTSTAATKNKRNKILTWYQVTTPSCHSEKELDILIEKIQKIKPLKSIKKVKA